MSSPRGLAWRLLPLLASSLVACCPGPRLPLDGSAAAPAPVAAPSESSPEPVGVEPPMTDAERIATLVAAADRDPADQALDAGRHPVETLAFFGVQPGMQVAELMAGGGYTAELLARAVGPDGKVWAQNNRFVLERFAEKPWTARLAKPVMAPVVRVDRELDDPLPPEARDLDAVFLLLFYHDAVWMEVDRAKMNAAIFAALKPGGVYAVIDHRARPGSGLADVKTLHRIEESEVRREIEAAGFVLDATGDFLKNPEDGYDWNASPSQAGERRGTSDRFVLRFVKPEG